MGRVNQTSKGQNHMNKSKLINDYKLVKCDTDNGIDAISALSNEGYELYGDPFVYIQGEIPDDLYKAIKGNTKGNVIVQAMVQYKSNTDDTSRLHIGDNDFLETIAIKIGDIVNTTGLDGRVGGIRTNDIGETQYYIENLDYLMGHWFDASDVSIVDC